jgi:hypothetical protein
VLNQDLTAPKKEFLDKPVEKKPNHGQKLDMGGASEGFGQKSESAPAQPAPQPEQAKVDEVKPLSEVDMQKQAFEAKPLESVTKIWFT